MKAVVMQPPGDKLTYLPNRIKPFTRVKAANRGRKGAGEQLDAVGIFLPACPHLSARQGKI